MRKLSICVSCFQSPSSFWSIMTEFIGTLDPARVSAIILMRCGKPFYTVSLLTVSATVYVLFCVMSHFSTLMASVFIFPHTHNCVHSHSFRFLLLDFTWTDRRTCKKKKVTERSSIISCWLFIFHIALVYISPSYLYIKGYQRI